MGWWSLWVLFSVCFWVIDVVGLSVFRKCLAPSSGKSTAAARCLRGGKRPARRHRASARCPCSIYRSLVCLSFLSGSFLSPHRHSVAAALYLGLRRSSRAPWSPLLASLSSSPPHAHRPLVTLSLRRVWVGFALTLAAYRQRSEWSPTHASALGSFFGVLDRPGRITLES